APAQLVVDLEPESGGSIPGLEGAPHRAGHGTLEPGLDPPGRRVFDIGELLRQLHAEHRIDRGEAVPQAPVATLNITDLTHAWDVLGHRLRVIEGPKDHVDGSVDGDLFLHRRHDVASFSVLPVD